MAAIQSRRNPDFVRRFFYLQNRTRDPLTAMQALCACAGKYLRTVWWLCVKDTVYDSEIASQGFAWAKRNSDEVEPQTALEVAS
jgi:hypothetical protein